MSGSDAETFAGATLGGARAAIERSPELAAGDLVGRYVVVAKLGAGGMGVVHAAYDPELDRKVALKLLHAQAGESAAARARLLREAQALAKLAHPNIVAVHDVGTVSERVWIAMELVAGTTLRAWLQKRRPWREVLAVLVAAGRGLVAAHAQGLVHRDFKPVKSRGVVAARERGDGATFQAEYAGGNNPGELGPSTLEMALRHPVRRSRAYAPMPAASLSSPLPSPSAPSQSSPPPGSPSLLYSRSACSGLLHPGDRRFADHVSRSSCRRPCQSSRSATVPSRTGAS